MTRIQKSAKYGLLSYSGTHNLGDEIQSIAARQFLPRVDQYVDRENLSNFISEQGDIVNLILNGWFAHHPENWPPSKYLNPLFVAFHISPDPSYKSGIFAKDVILGKPALKYLQAYAPIGARDYLTQEMLKSAGVESYFSGCMTLTLARPDVQREDDLIIVNELPQNALDYIKNNTTKRVEKLSHSDTQDGIARRFIAADALLAQYARASCVVTSRLHCALPCVAMGVPVFLVDVQHDQQRFSGLNEFCHHDTLQNFLNGVYDVNAPLKNPEKHLPFRENLKRRVTQFVNSSSNYQNIAYPLTLEDRCDILTLNQSLLTASIIKQREKFTVLEHRLNSLASRVDKIKK